MYQNRIDVTQLGTIDVLRAAIGQDAFVAWQASEELRRRGPTEMMQAFGPVWAAAPTSETTENFLRDAFATFGDQFMEHLLEVLANGTEAAVNVASLAFPRHRSTSGSI